MDYHRIIFVRNFSFLITGVILVAYGVLAMIWQTPEPFSWWIPFLFGIVTFFVIAMAKRAGGRKASHQAFDESFDLAMNRAQSISYWIALYMYPAFGLLMSFGWLNFSVSFATMGCFTGASLLLLFVWFDQRTNGHSTS